MQEDFKVSITGDISGLKKAVGDAEKELSSFASKSQSLKSAIAENIAISRGYDQAINELKKSFRSGAISQTQFKEALVRLKRDEKETAIETTKLKNELIDLNRAGAGLAKSTPQIGAGLKTVDKTGANATNTMMEFSRVVQDAPYGIRGVANNIQQLVGNFGYLSKSAGGAGNAMKAMASSLMGPAGILLAVSLVTSLLVQYGDALMKSIKGTEDAKVANDRLNDALREQLGLRKLLKDEIDVATRIAVAEAKLAGKNEGQQYAIKKKFSEANIAILESEYKEATKRYRAFHNKNMNLKSRGEDEITELVDESRKAQLDIQKELNDAKAQLYLDDLTEQIRVKEKLDKILDKAAKPSNIDLPVTNLTGFKQLEETFKDAFGRPIPSDQFKLLDNLPIVVGEMNSEIARLIGNIENMLPTDIWGNLNVPPDLFSNLNKMSAEELTIFRNNLDKTIMASSILNEAVSSSFTALGNSIAGSLKTDSELVNAFVGSIIGSMAQLLTALITTAITNLAIKEAVATGNAVTAATESAVATGPAAAWVLPALIAGTVAMVAGAFASIGGFAGGGIVPGGSFNGDKVPAFVNSGEMILNAGQQSNLFDILDGNLRKLGGQQQMQTINVQGELRGQTILLANKRAEKNSNRFYGRK